MMVIARIFPTESKEDLWKSLVETVPGLRLEDVTPLWLAQRQEDDFVSIVFDARSFEAMVPVFLDHLKDCRPVRRTKTSPLLNPVFFPVPKEGAEKLHRYRLALKVETSELRNVFERLARLEHRPEVFPTYQAISLGDDDILVSILAPDRGTAEEVVQKEIVGWPGVMEAALTTVTKSLRVATGEEWLRYRESHYLTPATEEEGFDWLDAAMSGAFVDEL
jgi:hypothetical protein